MPLSPFIGLSVLIHLVTILVFKLLNRKTDEVVIATRNKPTAVMRYFSLAIVFVVFTFISTSASLLLYGSITEKHSTINFINYHLSSLTNFDYSPVSNVSAAEIETKPQYKFITASLNQATLDN